MLIETTPESDRSTRWRSGGSTCRRGPSSRFLPGGPGAGSSGYLPGAQAPPDLPQAAQGRHRRHGYFLSSPEAPIESHPCCFLLGLLPCARRGAARVIADWNGHGYRFVEERLADPEPVTCTGPVEGVHSGQDPRRFVRVRTRLDTLHLGPKLGGPGGRGEGLRRLIARPAPARARTTSTTAPTP